MVLNDRTKEFIYLKICNVFSKHLWTYKTQDIMFQHLERTFNNHVLRHPLYIDIEEMIFTSLDGTTLDKYELLAEVFLLIYRSDVEFLEIFVKPVSELK
jgi:hypothetical protein